MFITGEQAQNTPIVAEEDLESVLRPMTMARWSVSDPNWQAQLGSQERAARLALWRKWLMPWRRRTTSQVRAQYEQVWTKSYPDITARGSGIHVIWRDEVYRIPKFGLNRFYIALVGAMLTRLKPRNVLDLGSGYGLNILILAGMHPSIQYTGVELTSMGLARAKSVQRGPLPANFQQFAPGPILDPLAHQRVRWVQADASRLPIRPAAFDVVISVLALEQMNVIRAEVLAELRRVVKGSYVGIEPFADWNRTPARRNYLAGLSYWQGSLADLEAAGFTVRASSDAFPQKVRFGTGLVWAETR